MRDTLVVVDPIKSGADMRTGLREAGAKVIDVYTLDRHFLDELGVTIPDGGEHICSNDVHEVAARLRPQAPQLRAVIPASEPSTSFVARLARALDLPSSHDPCPDRFRNKEAMRSHARNAGLAVPRFQAIEHGQDFEFPQSQCPHILKPLRAAGSDGVKIVATRDETMAHMERHARDLFGNANTRWLLEEYVTGPEVAINTVSSGGRHLLIDVWEYCQPAGSYSTVYDNPYWNTLQIGGGRMRDELAEFAAATLDGFAVEFGFCHIEAKRDLRSGRWHLIEIGWRLAGARMPWMWRNVWGIDVYGDLGSLYGGENVKLERYLPAHDAPLLGLVFIRSEREGVLAAFHGGEAVRALPEFVDLELYARPGDRVAVTDTLQNPLAKVLIKAPDRAGLEAACDRIRQLLTASVV